MVVTNRATTGGSPLEAELRRRLRGDVRFDAGHRALYAADASNFRQVPVGVVFPVDVDDVLAAVETARRHGTPLLPRGGGTSLAGQACNAALVLDCAKHLNRILEIDPVRRTARVEPGVIADHLNRAVKPPGLMFGPVPATHGWCTVGGMVGNNSCGVHSVVAGKTDDNVESLEVLTYDGLRLRVGPTSDEDYARIVAAGGRQAALYEQLRSLRDRYADRIRARFAPIPRRVSGFGLEHLLPEHGFNVARALVGTEGTCVTVLEATVRLIPSPAQRALLVLGYPDVFTAGDRVSEVMEHGPIALEGMDDLLVAAAASKGLYPAGRALLPPGRGWLLAEFGGETRDEALARAKAVERRLAAPTAGPNVRLVEGADQQSQLWLVRESGLAAAAQLPDGRFCWSGWEDSAVPPARFGAYLRDLRGLLTAYGYTGPFYGHFGEGCIHVRIDFDLETPAGIATYRRFMEAAADLVVRYGGSLSGEHGDGQSRGELIVKQYGPELVQAFREFKAIWDPAGKLNPGKVVGPSPLDRDLRLAGLPAPAVGPTHFQFPDDQGSFLRATLRCVGVGKCRRESGGTMCPSYLVTRDEEHTTRGRAHLLFEMLRGDVIQGGWHAEEVKAALDLCFACKACKAECPMRVDLATYKAEFLAHYYEQRRRPRAAYVFGLIFYWARLAALAPRLANVLTQTPGLRTVAKLAAGVAPQRTIPAFASQTFKDWFQRRPVVAPAGKTVILWADTFNNYFRTGTAQAAVEVLEAAGFSVRVPAASLCCGRPVYDFGLLETGKRLLRQVLQALAPDIRAGTPVVVLEPSCAAVFRDELLNLFPGSPLAARLAQQTFLLGEFLAREAPDFAPQLDGQALVHGHCHQQAVFGLGGEQAMLARTGVSATVLNAGCCGMAGAFGFEREHYDVSIRAGERVLLPAVRAADPTTLIVADGFSCREQIEQQTGRRTLHLAEVLQQALRRGQPARGGKDERARG